MVRTQIYLTQGEVDAIQTLASTLQLSRSEYIRRVLDIHIEKAISGSLKKSDKIRPLSK